jgi:hypothetical protein
MPGYVMAKICNHVTACLGHGCVAELKLVVMVTWAGQIDQNGTVSGQIFLRALARELTNSHVRKLLNKEISI